MESAVGSDIGVQGIDESAETVWETACANDDA